MEYFKINYYKLRNLVQRPYIYLLVIGVSFIVFFIVIANFFYIDKKIKCYGIYESHLLHIQIENRLSDKIKKQNTLTFNGTKTEYTINSYEKYSLDKNIIYQDIFLVLEKDFYNNEIGDVEIYYGKQTIWQFILELFK